MVSLKDHKKDFTRTNYKRLLKLASRKYKIGTVSDFQNNTFTCLWRHDVDFSPQSALAMAKIEHCEDIRASYYFMLQSDFYNLFEPAVITILRSIKAMGHEVGLHFDASQYDISSTEALETALTNEKNAFESIIGISINSFSFHNPTQETFKFKNFAYAGLVNAYNSELIEQFQYCSDSNGYWRFIPMEEFLVQNYPKIYVLTHPVWWQDTVLSPRERIVRSIEGRARATLEQYDKLLELNGRENISE